MPSAGQPNNFTTDAHISPAVQRKNALEYSQLGYACFSLQITWDELKQKKVVHYEKGWQEATVDNCLREFFQSSKNALAFVTGEPSDAIVVDVDYLKPKEIGKVSDGMHLMGQLLLNNKLPANAPQARTASGGTHYLFSLRQSLEHGLAYVGNRTKVCYKGMPTTIDVRGDGGNLLVAPSSYYAGNELRSYQWVNPIIPSADLPAMPDWLIEILNNDNAGNNLIASPSAFNGDSNKWLSHPMNNTFIDRVQHEISKMIAPNTIAQCYVRDKGFDFKLSDTNRPCPCCLDNVHESNTFKCRMILTDCFSIINYSSSCSLEIVNYEKHEVIKKIIACPSTDDAYVEMLQLHHRYEGQELCNTGYPERFMCFDGAHWVELSKRTVQQHVRILANRIISALSFGIWIRMERCKDKDKEEYNKLNYHHSQLYKAKLYMGRANNIEGVTTSARQLLWNEPLYDRLDKNKDLFGVPGGVIYLPTGEWRPGRFDDFVATSIQTEYKGIDYPTPDITAFMWSLFEDQSVIDFLQKLWGYGITGHTREQVWMIAHGVGSNGKSLCAAMLEALLEKGKYFVPMSKDCLVKGGRVESKNAPKPYLLALKDRRFAVCEELGDDAVLDDAIVKAATGESMIADARNLHGNPVSFFPTHLAVVVTNIKPKVNVDDDAMRRRILFLSFTRKFVTEANFDKDNEMHRLIDKKLKDKLLIAMLDKI